MKDIVQALLIGLVVVAIAIFGITFYYSIFVILFIILAVTFGYITVIARKEITKTKDD